MSTGVDRWVVKIDGPKQSGHGLKRKDLVVFFFVVGTLGQQRATGPKTGAHHVLPILDIVSVRCLVNPREAPGAKASSAPGADYAGHGLGTQTLN